MTPTIPLDVNNKQIRVGHKVVYGNDNGSILNVGTVWKITPCFVWMKTNLDNEYSSRREFRRVAVINDGVNK